MSFKSFFIVSTRPYKRLLFVSFKSMSLSLKKLTNSSKTLYNNSKNLFCLQFFGRFGSFFIFFFVRNIVFCSTFLINLGLLLEFNFIKNIEKKICLFLVGIQFAWMTVFSIEGYHFRIFRKRLKKLKRVVLKLRLGFLYRVVIVLPKSLRIFWKKRFFRLRGSDLVMLYMVSMYIRMVRNLFPYKVKGIVYDNYGLSKGDFERQVFFIKPGKKAKLR